MGWYTRVDELECLAFLDEAEPYTVDQCGVYLDTKSGKFYVLTASGCSCWSGEYDEEEYDTLSEVFAALDDGSFPWHVSIAGSEDLKQQLRDYGGNQHLLEDIE